MAVLLGGCLASEPAAPETPKPPYHYFIIDHNVHRLTGGTDQSTRPCTYLSASSKEDEDHNCSAIEVCSRNFIANQEGISDHGVIYFDGGAAANVAQNCSTTISARPGQHVGLIFQQQPQPLRGGDGSLLVGDPGLLGRNQCEHRGL